MPDYPNADAALADPSFRDFLAQRAQELAAAQKEAAERQGDADVSNRFVRGGALIAGREVDPAQIAANNARAQLPVTQVLQRQGAQGTAIKDLDTAQQVQERGAKATQMRASADPNSELSKRARLLAVHMGMLPASYPGEFTAGMFEELKAGKTLQQTAEQHALEREFKDKELKQKIEATHQDVALRIKELAQRRAEMSGQRQGLADDRMLQRFTQGDQKARASLAAYDAAERLVKRLEKLNGETPGIGTIKSGLPAALLSDIGQLNQADAIELMKSMLLAKGGATQGPAMEAQMKALGGHLGQNAGTFKNGIDTALHEVQSAMQQREAGLRPDLLEQYRANGGKTSHDIAELRKRLAPFKNSEGSGIVTVRDKTTGATKRLLPGRAQVFLADPKFEQVQDEVK